MWFSVYRAPIERLANVLQRPRNDLSTTVTWNWPLEWSMCVCLLWERVRILLHHGRMFTSLMHPRLFKEIRMKCRFIIGAYFSECIQALRKYTFRVVIYIFRTIKTIYPKTHIFRKANNFGFSEFVGFWIYCLDIVRKIYITTRNVYFFKAWMHSEKYNRSTFHSDLLELAGMHQWSKHSAMV